MSYIGKTTLQNKANISIVSEKKRKHKKPPYYCITSSVFFMSASFVMSDMP